MFHMDHTALSVTNMDKSIDFYENLGFEVTKKWLSEDDSLQITMLKLDDVYLELFCYKTHTPLPESAKSVASDLLVLGTKHVALHTDDLQAAIEYLLEHKIITQTPEIKTGRLGRDYFFIPDPDGIQVEIISRD